MLNWLQTATGLKSGVRLHNDKSDTLRSRIMPTPLPPFLRISLRQADGGFSSPLVSTGDRVLGYQCIAEAASTAGAPVFTPASGTVVAVDEQNSIYAEGSEDLCVTVAVDEEQEYLTAQKQPDFRDQQPETILQRIESAGVRGGAGVGFPVARKLRLGLEHRAGLLIINAVECEPYISADEALIREYAREVIAGAEILQYTSGSERCVIAFQQGKPDALQILREALQGSSIEVHLARDIYPAGQELQLISDITGKQVPADKNPVECGVLVFNAGAARNVFLAVVHGIPCISRIVTLAGEALQTPKNFDVMLGTPVKHLLELCGAASEETFSTIIGSPLSGHFLFDTDSGIDITSRCVIAAGEDEFQPQPNPLPCNHCGDCLSACSVGLKPYEIHRMVQAGNIPGLQKTGLDACIDCGACTYSCPSSINLAHSLQHGKSLLAEDDRQTELSKKWQQRYQFLQYRRKRDKQEASERKAITDRPAATPEFSRDQARLDIAAAVARVKAKREGNKS